jgi:RNA polymerase sigma-70 factor (ECF subfamily)
MCDQNECNKLIRWILSGDKHAYSELYDKTILYVYKNVHFLVEEKNDIDDLIQDIYIQLYNSLSKYDHERPFKPWLMGIAIKQIQSYRRNRWMRFRIAKKAEEYKQVTAIDFSNDLVDKIANEDLIKLVNKLPYKLKQVIILRYLNDHTQEEVASILDIPVGTVKSRIHSALKKLRSNELGKKLFFEKVGNV